MPAQHTQLSPRHIVLSRTLEHSLELSLKVTEQSSTSFQEVLHVIIKFFPVHPALHAIELALWCVIKEDLQARSGTLADSSCHLEQQRNNHRATYNTSRP